MGIGMRGHGVYMKNCLESWETVLQSGGYFN